MGRASCSSRHCLAQGSSAYPRASRHHFPLSQDSGDLITPCKIPLGLGKDLVHDLSACQLSSRSQGWGHQRGPPGEEKCLVCFLGAEQCFVEEPGPFITNPSIFLGYLAPFFDTTSWEKKNNNSHTAPPGHLRAPRPATSQQPGMLLELGCARTVPGRSFITEAART